MGATFKLTARAGIFGFFFCFALASADAEERSETSAAQIAPAGVDDQIVVLGSRIKRRDFIAPSPITTIDRSDIEFSGSSNIEDLLNQLPQVTPSVGRYSNNPGNGAALVSLRGLGAQRTLVMLNGRRFAPTGVESYVDLNSLPQGLIERIEIITGGASTVYGSDAVAGVVNFITRDDWDGIETSARHEISQKGDAQTLDLNIGFGTEFQNGRGNVQLFYNYQDRDPLILSERKTEKVTLRENLSGELIPSGSPSTPEGHIFFPPVFLDGGIGSVTFRPDGTPRLFNDPDDFFLFAPYNYLQIPLERHSGGAFFNYEISDTLEFYGEVLTTHSNAARRLAPTPASLFVSVNLDNPLLTDETRMLFEDNYLASPGFAAFPFGRRLVELGSRVVESRRDYRRYLAGLRGQLKGEWEFDIYFSRTRGQTKESRLNDASRSRFRQALLVDPVSGECFDPSGGCVPADFFGEGRLSEAAVEFIRFAPFENLSENTQYIASAFARGPALSLPAGSLDVAAGIEWRRDSGFFRADPILFNFDTLGFGADASVDGTSSVIETYAEALIPLMSGKPFLEYFGLEIGGRLSNYNSSGLVTTYKAGAEWRVNDIVMLRAMRQKSVRAPNRGELFTESVTQPTTFVNAMFNNDFCSASFDPIGTGIAQNCIASGLSPDQIGVFEAAPFYPAEFISGGNPDLSPETAKTLTAGVVFNPFRDFGFTLAVDYYDIKITSVIGGVDALAVCFDPRNVSGLFCDLITRDATGNIVFLDGRLQNTGNQRARGVDTAAKLSVAAPDFLSLSNEGADLNVQIIWTHVLENSTETALGETTNDCVGVTLICGDNTPKNRVTSNFNYTSGNLSAQLTWRWLGGMESGLPVFLDRFGFVGYTLAAPTVESEHYFDLGFSYDLDERIALTGGVNNLFDNDPPYVGEFSTNTDPRLYDTLGRRFYFAVRAAF